MANQAPKCELDKVAPLAVTLSGKSPSSMKWEYTEDMICEEVKKLLVDMVPDIVDVTVEDGKDRVEAFAWLPKKSSNLIDPSTKGSALGKPIHSYSKQLKELMERYCPKDSKRLVVDTTPGSNLVGIPIELRKVFTIIMDCSGTEAYNLCGNSIKSKLNLTAVYRRGDGNESHGKLLYVEVEKTTTMRARKKPRPTKNFRY